jgi:hypothetical protein
LQNLVCQDFVIHAVLCNWAEWKFSAFGASCCSKKKKDLLRLGCALEYGWPYRVLVLVIGISF